jgi:SAM-dependent methyltransferase
VYVVDHHSMTAEAWGRRPRDWADLAEPSNHRLFEKVLHRLQVGHGTHLLDIGCGSGYAARLAAERGAVVTGLDLAPELLAIARERLPHVMLVEAGMDALPFSDAAFDAVVAFNAFPFAADPARAVGEAARVVVPGGRVAATTFAEPERNESTALHLALEPLRHASSPGGQPQHLPYALSEPGGLEDLLAGAGLTPAVSGEVAVTWDHDTVDQAVRAVLASGGGAMAIAAAGEPAARAALTDAVQPFVHGDGRVEMHNVFRYAIAAREPGVTGAASPA